MNDDHDPYILLEGDVNDDPLRQFQTWFEQACEFGFKEPGAMTLATVDDRARPSARMVLFKGLIDGGFSFYSNYTSRKGHDLEHNPNVALVFYWDRMFRQVRIEGVAARMDEAASQQYFHSRPRGSQLGALASRQSRVIDTRDELDARMQEVEARYEGQDVPWQPHWGGYRVEPETIEFWQGRRNRLHDRLRYQRDNAEWTIERLEP